MLCSDADAAQIPCGDDLRPRCRSKIYKGGEYADVCPLEYLQHGKMHDHMHPETYALLLRFLTQLRDEGEDAMFASLREWVREK